MGELRKLPNIGEMNEKQLNEVGIYTAEDLKRAGSKEAWVRIRLIDSSACINRLMAFEGAIQGIRWHNLSEATKNDLREFVKGFKK